MTRKVAAARTRAVIGEAKKLVGGGAALLAPKVGAIAKTALGKLGIAAAAGLVAYKVTRKVVDRLALAKQQKHQRALQEAFIAARDRAAQELGRRLTPGELALLDAEVERQIGS